MSHNPPKNMYKDENGVARFLATATAPDASNGKRWFKVEITRTALNKDGEVIDRDRQTTEVFGTEETCSGLAFARCPSGLKTKEAFEFSNQVYFQLLGNDMFVGHKTENQQFLEAVKAEQMTIVVN